MYDKTAVLPGKADMRTLTCSFFGGLMKVTVLKAR